MEGTKLSRRQFLGGTAAVAAASVLPAIANMTPAMATPTAKFPDASIFTPGNPAWIPLDAEKAARRGWETYKGRFSGDGQGG
ncbi:MAG: twin-arginine translocation signal domain-containing protein [Coriobacteriia bacterium]